MMRMQPITHTKQCKRMILVLDCMWGSISILCNLLLIKWTMRSMEISTWSPWKPVKLNFLVWNKCFELLGYQCRVKEIYITVAVPHYETHLEMVRGPSNQEVSQRTSTTGDCQSDTTIFVKNWWTENERIYIRIASLLLVSFRYLSVLCKANCYSILHIYQFIHHCEVSYISYNFLLDQKIGQNFDIRIKQD